LISSGCRRPTTSWINKKPTHSKTVSSNSSREAARKPLQISNGRKNKKNGRKNKRKPTRKDAIRLPSSNQEARHRANSKKARKRNPPNLLRPK